MCPAAHVGYAYVILKTADNSPHIGHRDGPQKDETVGPKIEALNNLKMAREMLKKDVGQYRDCQRRLSDPSTSRLAHQLNETIRALEGNATVVEETYRCIQLSLRPVQVTF